MSALELLRWEPALLLAAAARADAVAARTRSAHRALTIDSARLTSWRGTSSSTAWEESYCHL